MPVYGSGAYDFYQINDRLIVVFNDGRITNIEILKNYNGHSC